MFALIVKNYHDCWLVSKDNRNPFLGAIKSKLLESRDVDAFKYLYDRYYHKLFTKCKHTGCKEEAYYVGEFCVDHQKYHLNYARRVIEDNYLPHDLVEICFQYMVP
jgi:hypothetical protein